MNFFINSNELNYISRISVLFLREMHIKLELKRKRTAKLMDQIPNQSHLSGCG